MTNLKLQKLVYYAQAWNLAFTNYPLFKEEIEAWVHGPVIPSLYQQYRSSGWNSISSIPSEEPKISRDDIDHLQEVWDIYGGYDAKYLEALTHHESPWQMAREGFEAHERANIVISNESMIEYYQGILLENPDG